MNVKIPYSDRIKTPLGQPHSLRPRLLTVMGGILLVTLLSVGASVLYFTFQNEQRIWQERQAETAYRTAEIMAAFVQRTQDMLTLVGLAKPTMIKNQAGLLDNMLAQNPNILEIICLDKQGKVFAGAYQDAPLLANLFTLPQSIWFLESRAGQLYLGQVELSAESEPYLIISVPTPDQGVVAARLRLQALWDMLAELHFGQTGQVYLINRQGDLIAHPQPEVALAAINLAQQPEMAALLQAAEQRWTGAYVNFVGHKVVGSTAPVGVTSWIIVAEMAQREAYAVSRTALLLFGSGLLLFGWLMMVVMSRFLRRLILQPIEQLRAGATHIGRGDWSYQISITHQDEFGQVAQAFNDMVYRLRQREREIIGRTQALATSAKVSRSLSTMLDLNQLATDVVEQIRAAFDYYYAQLYLFDEGGQNLVMAGGTGEVGRVMLAQGHTITRGKGPVGRAAESNRIILIPDVAQEAGWLPNPLLPETKAEVAVPITSGSQVLGVLDVQHNVVGSLGRDEAELIQSIANQVAIALQNVRLFEQAQRQASREALINSIGQKIQRATTIEEVLQTTVRELGQALGSQQATIQLGRAVQHVRENDNILF